MQSIDASDEFWRNKAGVIRSFLDGRPAYEKLAEEVAYILERAVRCAGIEYAHVAHRAKTLNSFCEKVNRKGYRNPLSDITDVAGVRITFLYLADRPKLESIAEREFEVMEKVDKVDKSGAERFGYGALHYLVKLGKKASGARYDELKGLVCEIQVRTILQDAWAIVDHHLSYKEESDVPEQLRRKLNALSGLFETADDQFDRLRVEREAYAAEVKKQIAEQGPEFLRHGLDLENLIEYLSWRFSDRGNTSREEAADLLSELTRRGYRELAPIDAAVCASYDALKAYETKYPPINEETGQNGPYSPVGAIRVALSFGGACKAAFAGRLEEFRHLLKPTEGQNKAVQRTRSSRSMKGTVRTSSAAGSRR
jgi:ppGpp synthetase/RelA/SpoT-type nucleotidyltranferase